MEIIIRESVILVIFSVIIASEQKASPCPDRVFTYEQDDKMRWFGKIEIPSAGVDNILKLSVDLSWDKPPSSSYEGHIELLNDPKVVYEDIVYERPIKYKVVFPLGPVPSLVSITFNKRNYCSGVKLKQLATSIRLNHLRIYEDEDEEKDELNTTTKPARPISTRKPITENTTRRRNPIPKDNHKANTGGTIPKLSLTPGPLPPKPKMTKPTIQSEGPKDNEYEYASVDYEDEKPIEDYDDGIESEDQYPDIKSFPKFDIDLRRRTSF